MFSAASNVELEKKDLIYLDEGAFPGMLFAGRGKSIVVTRTLERSGAFSPGPFCLFICL
jgi:hypothetical protein